MKISLIRRIDSIPKSLLLNKYLKSSGTHSSFEAPLAEELSENTSTIQLISFFTERDVSLKEMIVRYLAVVSVLAIGFANFIACGSQMYKVSVEEDFDQAKVQSTSNPEVNDPESTVYGIHAVDGWKQLPIQYRFGSQLNEEQRKHLSAAMHIWEAAVGKTLFKVVGIHSGTTGDRFTDLYSSLDDNVNGHYLDDDWEKTKKPVHVLATTIWHTTESPNVIATADIRFNNAHYIIGDSLVNYATDSKEVVDMQSLALHELGHLLGLAHVSEDVDGLSIMNPTLYIGEGLTSRQLSRGDIERIQTIYGCEGEACDIEKVLAKLGQMEGQALTDPLSLVEAQ